MSIKYNHSDYQRMQETLDRLPQPSLEDLAIQAATFLEEVSDEFTVDSSRINAKHIAYALRERVESASTQPDGGWLEKHFAKHPHVSLVDGVLGGMTPVVSKTRISVHDILGYLYNRCTIPEIAEIYNLSEDAVRDAIAFADDVYNEAIHGPDDEDDRSSNHEHQQ